MYIILDLNKPLIIGNGGELSDLDYLPTKTEYIEYLQIADTRTPRPSGPFKQYNGRCKQAQDHKKQWRIDLPRLPAHQNRKCEISPEHGHASLLSIGAH